MTKVTLFKNLRNTKPSGVCDLDDVLFDIRSGKWSTLVEKCKTDLANKEKLPCFTPTGIFEHRSIKGLQEYNGIICLDIDHVDNVQGLKEECKSIPWIYAAFITPSGKGLKVIVKTDADINTYTEVEKSVAERFEQLTGYQRDNRAKDIARIQFVSFDAEIWINKNSTFFV